MLENSPRLLARQFAVLGLVTPAHAIAVVVAPESPVNLSDLAKVSFGLVIVVVLIVALAAVLKRVKSVQTRNGKHIQILDALSLGTRDRIVLVEVDDTRVLVGVSPGQIHALHAFGIGQEAEKSFTKLLRDSDRDLKGVQ